MVFPQNITVCWSINILRFVPGIQDLHLLILGEHVAICSIRVYCLFFLPRATGLSYTFFKVLRPEKYIFTESAKSVPSIMVIRAHICKKNAHLILFLAQVKMLRFEKLLGFEKLLRLKCSGLKICSV